MEAVDAQIADMENAAAMSHMAMLGRKAFTELEAAGWPKVTDGKVPENVRALLKDWHVAVNVTDDMDDNVPVLVSSNLDPSLLLGAWDGKTDAATKFPLEEDKEVSPKTAWRNAGIVVVTKGGFSRFFRKKYMRYDVVYSRRAFSCPEDFAYATTNGLVKPARKTGGKK